MLLRNACFLALGYIGFIPHSVTAKEFFGINFKLSQGWEERGYSKHPTECNEKGYLSIATIEKGVKYNFTGTRIEVHFVVASDGAVAEVELENQPTKQISTFNSLANPATCSLIMYDSGNITMGLHSVSIFHGGNDPSYTAQNSTLRVHKLITYMDVEPTLPGEGIPKPTSDSADSKPPPIGAIVGGVVGGVACIVLMIVIIMLAFRRSRSTSQEYHKLGDGKSVRSQSLNSSVQPLHGDDSASLMRTTSLPESQPLYQQQFVTSPVTPFHGGNGNSPSGFVSPYGPPPSNLVSPSYNHINYPISPPSQPPPFYQASPTTPYGGWSPQSPYPPR